VTTLFKYRSRWPPAASLAHNTQRTIFSRPNKLTPLGSESPLHYLRLPDYSCLRPRVEHVLFQEGLSNPRHSHSFCYSHRHSIDGALLVTTGKVRTAKYDLCWNRCTVWLIRSHLLKYDVQYFGFSTAGSYVLYELWSP
jgi:hypothetical protein